MKLDWCVDVLRGRCGVQLGHLVGLGVVTSPESARKDGLWVQIIWNWWVGWFSRDILWDLEW